MAGTWGAVAHRLTPKLSLFPLLSPNARFNVRVSMGPITGPSSFCRMIPEASRMYNPDCSQPTYRTLTPNRIRKIRIPHGHTGPLTVPVRLEVGPLTVPTSNYKDTRPRP